VIRPYLEDVVLDQDRDWTEMIRASIKDMAIRAVTIPESLQQALGRANRGELEIRVPEIADASRMLYAAAHQLIYCIVGVTAGVIAYQAYDRGRGTLAVWLLGGAAVCMVGLVLSVARMRRRV
jgi:ubiquinone biosynthesis protein